MAPCLSKFPSVCLEAIFKHLPLVDLFYSAGLVCATWYKPRQTELMRRHRLRLVESSLYLEDHRVQECSYSTELIEHVRREDGSRWHTLESVEHMQFNCLSVPHGMETVPFFASLMNMSNITRLHLNLFRTSSDVTKVIRLIDHLSVHLVELKLCISIYVARDFVESGIEDNYRATREYALNETNVIDCLNRTQTLRHLKLVLSGDLHSNLPLLSCLSRLTTFSISAQLSRSMDGWFIPSLRQYAQNVTSIAMDNQVNIQSMLQIDAQLASKFNVLSVMYNANFNHDNDELIDDMRDMSLFCARFSSLTKLKLDSFFAPLPMTKLARCLSSLTQLVHLDLTIFDTPPVEADQLEDELEDEGEVGDGEAEQEEEEIGEIEDQAQPGITQVPSVRLLAIHLVFTKSHHDSERLFIAEIFSNLQVLRFEHTFEECSDCEISRVDRFARNEQNADPERTGRIAECTRLARQPFRRCGHLHTVALVVSGDETLINIDDL